MNCVINNEISDTKVMKYQAEFDFGFSEHKTAVSACIKKKNYLVGV